MQINIKTKPYYKVKSDDTIKSICSKFKIVEEELMQLNSINKLEEGDVIIIPKSYKYFYVVKPLDSYEKIAKNLNVSVDTIIKATKGKPMFIGQKIVF